MTGILLLAASLLASAQSTPADPALAKAYTDLGPYHGITVPGVDMHTLTGKVMCGYQGWFGAPGDGSDANGWRHWTKHHGPLEDGNAKVDLWPDVSELTAGERFATGFKLPDGRNAEVFSSYEKPTVLRHFSWMEQYGIDGAFVQRFTTDVHNLKGLQRVNKVLADCREGANLHGRTYAVMYDLSGLPQGHMQDVMNDWRQLRKGMAITEDPAYLHHHGKPVVCVWGVGFSDDRKYTVAECGDLVRFLKNDPEAGGCTVMLGVPTHWRELGHDAVSDPALLEVVAAADIVSPWTVGRYASPAGAATYTSHILGPDLAWCRQHRLECMPVVFPGFSWYNMYGRAFNLAPRLHGQFLWSQLLGTSQAGAAMVYVAMFDEVDEGTAIFKCANIVPAGQASQFLNFEGLPSDFYLRLTGAGGNLLRGENPGEAIKDVNALLQKSHHGLL